MRNYFNPIAPFRRLFGHKDLDSLPCNVDIRHGEMIFFNPGGFGLTETEAHRVGDSANWSASLRRTYTSIVAREAYNEIPHFVELAIQEVKG